MTFCKSVLFTIAIAIFCVAAKHIRTMQQSSDILPDGYVGGGTPAVVGQYPWIVRINSYKRGALYLCGGSLISDRHVLSAAHCFFEVQKLTDIKVYLGEYNYDTFPRDCVEGKCTHNIMLHPDKAYGYYFDNITYNNDIAILRLEKRVQLSDTIQPIPLPTFDPEDTYPGKIVRPSVVIAGWGWNHNLKTSNVLLSAEINILNRTMCTREHGYMPEGHFCAGDPNGNSMCPGDSGGPLVMLHENKYYLAGIVSYTKEYQTCPVDFGYFTNVYKYKEFIETALNISRNLLEFHSLCDCASEVMFEFSLMFTVLQLCLSSAQDIKPENLPILDFDNFPTWWDFGSPDPSHDEDRIVGGQEAFIEDHPYQVSFIVNNSYFCGGFIVSEKYILTAAHCAQDVDPTTVVLRAGSASRKNGTIIPIAEVTPHPEYDDPPFDKDVAVMKTVDPITFSDTIQPIDLPKINRPIRGGTKIMVSGWGRTKQGASSIPERLMDVEIPVVYWPQCYLSYPGTLTRNMWCGGNFFLGGQGTCQGDSGGAAIQDGQAVGIVSFGRGCAQPLSPSVFADIAAPTIREFITKHTDL
ncbi:transmembrane protease serine 9-like [Choristoneura fumiferana]|uniref:transmembrane protease serine 9-like n=1 Tax=Choristoneura fumiferana TaxID=7141 RepID=UPI003D15CC48